MIASMSFDGNHNVRFQDVNELTEGSTASWNSLMADLLLTNVTFSLVAGSMKGLTSCQSAQNMVGASYIHSLPSLNSNTMVEGLGRQCLICRNLADNGLTSGECEGKVCKSTHAVMPAVVSHKTSELSETSAL